MEYVAVYNDPIRPDLWAADRGAEGWTGVAMADHVSYGGKGWRHPFSVLGAMAASTDRVLLTTAYANNLMRSPVEVAQAALTLQALTGGRYEVGLGAGWAEAEITGSSLDYPDARTRAQRFREAVMIVRDLLPVLAASKDSTTRSTCQPPARSQTHRLRWRPLWAVRGPPNTLARCSTASKSPPWGQRSGAGTSTLPSSLRQPKIRPAR